jgi:hypothetical protein
LCPRMSVPAWDRDKGSDHVYNTLGTLQTLQNRCRTQYMTLSLKMPVVRTTFLQKGFEKHLEFETYYRSPRMQTKWSSWQSKV